MLSENVRFEEDFPKKNCHAIYGRKSPEIFRFRKCCLVSGNVQEMRRNREPYRCTSAFLRAASRILAMDGNLTDEEDAIASAAIAVTRSRMLAAELVVGESLFDFESGDVCAGSALWQDDHHPEQQIKRSRRSYERPDYMGSRWGQWFTKLTELSNAPGVLDPECREVGQFRTAFRLPYEIYVEVLDAVMRGSLPVFIKHTGTELYFLDMTLQQ